MVKKTVKPRLTERKIFHSTRRSELLKTATNLVLRILKHDTFFLISEFVVLLFFEKFDAVIGILLGTVAMAVGIFSIALSYENYGIISLGKLRIPRMYFLRYAFYAGVFLISALISDERVWGILGTFIGMLNFKVVIFSFGWRWSR
ncbi:hypothetical protein [Fervidobacterium thailandense]|uniref:Uncharacterized protein n=1 Tax=Fervidobacterium thailandense TaxID=1008305 RepID=A0A1E3G4J7_9BACT|nr:hypothetical protein [Fervidobacterium thailandense]ODN31177.1 hypothetical protein A4H02_02660 [Fervidobacterium thailandense]